MVARGVRGLHALTGRGRVRAAVLAALVATGCRGASAADLRSAASANGLAPEALIVIGEEALAARVRNGAVEVVVLARDGGGWRLRPIGSSSAEAGTNSGHLFAHGGATAQAWNSFFYGTAAAGVARVEVEALAGIGGDVVDGAWLIAFREPDLEPQDLAWRFLDADRRVLASGRGIFSPAD